MSAILHILGQQVSTTQAILDKCTVYPFAVFIGYRSATGVAVDSWRIVMAHSAGDIDEVSFVPPGCELMRTELMPVERLHALPVSQRGRYRAAFVAYWMWRRSRSIDKPLADMKPHTDYDPILMDEEVRRWVQPVGRYCGD